MILSWHAGRPETNNAISMNDQSSNPDIQARWKNRYYDTLGELESKEKSWREVERLLRQLISRLTLAADTRHEQLSSQLKELRNAVRDGRDILQLRELIEDISENVAELDRLRKKDNKYTHPANLVTDIIEQLNLPNELSRSFKQLKKKASKLEQDSAPDILNSEFVSLLNDIIEPPDVEKKETRKSKILDRILSREKKAAEASSEGAKSAEQLVNDSNSEVKPVPQKLVAPAVGDLLLQLTLRMPDAVKRRINFPVLKKHTNQARARKDLIAIVDVIAQQIEAAYASEEPDTIILDDESIKALSEAIKIFFSQISPPSDLQARICQLEEYFVDHNDDVESIVHCINSLADVVAEICNRLAYQHDELEGFFIQLTTRLHDIDAGLNKAVEFNALGNNNTQKMDRAVQGEMDGINNSILTINDIEPLKESIKKRIDAIADHIQIFHDSESARLKESEQHIKQLTEKIAKMECDSERLRSHLEETQQQAYKDVLTGVPNRHAYEERLSEEVARARRYNTALCMVVWDVDKFKGINDNYGHAAGDRVLKVIAETLNDSIRETDFLARFGGEEFILLLPGTELESTRQVAEKLRVSIEQTPFHFRDTNVTITVSGGIAQLNKDETSNSLFERADKALYKAKENGRNQLQLAD